MEHILKSFKALYQSGNVVVQKVGNAFVASSNRFDPLSGVAIDPEVIAIDPAFIANVKASTQDILTNIEFLESILADL